MKAVLMKTLRALPSLGKRGHTVHQIGFHKWSGLNPLLINVAVPLVTLSKIIIFQQLLFNFLDSYASIGYESEAKSHSERYGARTPIDNPSPPACLRWSYSLHRLLEDADGVELFRRYLQSEGRPHADALDFWFACVGLKKQKEPDRVQQIVKAIYK